tara:strand:- start:336 stop:611 length:276 start_codon:yes stop_codon:yes gene_type:complete
LRKSGDRGPCGPCFHIMVNQKVFMSDEKIDRDTHDHDLTYENEQSTVTIPLKEYDKLKEQGNYITDPSLISVIDKIEELVRALRKHIVRKF